MLKPPTVNTAEQLLDAVHNFVSETGMAETLILTRCGLSRDVFRNLRDGKGITTTTHDKILNFMNAERARRAAPPAPEALASEEEETPRP